MGKWKRNRSNKRRWERNHLINKYGAICALCGEKIEKMKDITIDHIIPISKGGDSTIENYQLAHLACNQTKADMTPEEFIIFQKGGELVE